MGALNLTPVGELVDGGRGEAAQMFTIAGDSKNLNTSGTSARTTLPTGSRKFRIVPDIDMYIKFGDDSVTAAAGDVLVASGSVEYFQPPSSATHVAAIDK